VPVAILPVPAAFAHALTRYTNQYKSSGFIMDIPQALIIVQKLANGTHPFKGTELPAKSVCQYPDSVRALAMAAEALKQVQSLKERQQVAPARAGAKWGEAEQAKLTSAFKSGRTIPQLAAYFQRTEWAIKARLVKHGLLEE
jgi:hypothetical protein